VKFGFTLINSIVLGVDIIFFKLSNVSQFDTFAYNDIYLIICTTFIKIVWPILTNTPTTQFLNPSSFNLFAYVNNNGEVCRSPKLFSIATVHLIIYIN